MTITNPNNAGTTINPQLASYDCGANVQYYCNKTAGNTQVCFKVDVSCLGSFFRLWLFSNLTFLYGLFQTVDANGTPGGFTECFPNYSYQTITCNNGKWANGTQTITALTCTQVSEPKPCAPLVMTNVNNAVISANPAQTSYAIGATPMFNCGRPGNVPVGSKKICMVEYVRKSWFLNFFMDYCTFDLFLVVRWDSISRSMLCEQCLGNSTMPKWTMGWWSNG